MKRRSKAKSVSDILSTEGSTLQALVSQQESLKAMEQKVIQLLPAMLQPHCRVSSFSPLELTISVRSAIWKTRLNQYSMQLISDLRQQGFHALARITAVVVPDNFEP